MAAQTPTCEPDKITAGDTATWIKTLQDFPASEGWTLTYALIMRAAAGPDAPYTFNAVASGNDYLVNVAAGVTVGWKPADYSVQAYVVGSGAFAGQRYRVWEGTITVEPNFVAGGVGDVRTHERKVLDAIQAVMEKRAGQEILEWTVEGILLRKASVNDLLALLDRYTVKVQKQEAAARVKAGRASGKKILTRFVRPGQVQGWPPGFVRG